MKSFLTGLFSLSIFIANSQSIKIYSGSYQCDGQYGKATYQYYEDANSERVYNGTFNFISDNNEITISGFYTKNLKDKAWTATYTECMNTYYGNSCNKNTVSGLYALGKLNGTWTVKYTRTVNNQVFKQNKYSVNFKNNIVTGPQNIALYDPHNEDSIIMKGVFDNNGFMTGNWNIKEKGKQRNSEYICEYKNGILLKYLERDYSTGAILDKFDQSEFVNQLALAYDTTKQLSIIDGHTFVLSDSISSFNSAENIVMEFLSYWAFNNTGIITNGNPINAINKGAAGETVQHIKKVIIRQ